MQVPLINQEAKILSSHLTSYQFVQKQQVSLANHLDSIQDKDLPKLLKQELKRAQRLEDKLLSDMKTHIQDHPKLQKDF